MTYNLTEKQRAFAKWIIRTINEETFFIFFPDNELSPMELRARIISSSGKEYDYDDVDEGTVEGLAAESLLRVAPARHPPRPQKVSMGFAVTTFRKTLRCTITGKLKEAVKTNFRDQTPVAVANTSVVSVPAEIVASLERFRRKFPDASGVGFLIMRFAAAKPYSRIVNVIKDTGRKHGLNLLRADENEFHSDLLGNVRTHLHGCSFGVAVYERIETDEPNANVGLEVGYLLAMNKPVLLLKDKTVTTLQADLAGKLYKPFDPHDPEGTIPSQMTKWLEDNGIILSTK